MGAETTLRIDADTARLIAKIADSTQRIENMAKSAGKLGDGFEGVEKAVEGVGSKLTATLGVVGLVTAGVRMTQEVFREWERSLERSAATAKGLLATLPGSQGGDLSNIGSARSALLGLDSPLSATQRGSAYQAFRRGAPTASQDEAINAVRTSGDAGVAGFDADEFAGHMAKLRFMGGRNGDAAAYIGQRAGGNSDQVVELLGAINAKLGSEQASAALPLAVGAARTPGGLDVLSSAFHAFSEQGRSGSFVDAFQNTGMSLVPGLGTRRTLAGVQHSFAGENGQTIDGRLGSSIAAARGDFQAMAFDTAARGKSRNDIQQDDRWTDVAAFREIDQNLTDAYTRNIPTGLKWTASLGVKWAGRFGAFNHYYDKQVVDAQHDVTAVQEAYERSLSKQTAELQANDLQNRRPTVGTQGEH